MTSAAHDHDTLAPPRVEEVSDGVFAYIQPDGSWCLNNTGFLVGGDGVVSIDTTSTERRTRAYLAAIASVTDAPLRTLVNTHSHLDHTNGNCFFGPVTIVAHERCRTEVLAAPPMQTGRGPFPGVEWGAIEKAPPTLTFEDTVTVFVDDLRCEVRYVGTPAHTTNDVVIWLPERSVLFAGDLVFNGGTPFNVAGSISGARRVLEDIRALAPAVIVPGHGDVCGVEVIDGIVAYLDFVTETATAGREAGLTPLEATREADLGEFAGLLDPERIVGNLHRAYAEFDGAEPGAPIGMAALAEMVEYNGGRPLPLPGLMPHYRAAGEIPKKRHTRATRPDGGLYAEELMSAQGFSGMTSLLYHRGLPTAIVEAEAFEGPPAATSPNHPLLPRHFRTGELPSGADLVTGRHLLLANADIRIGYGTAAAPSPLYRNAVGDECVFVQSGTGTVETSFGRLEVRDGDYVVIPKSTTHRWVPTPGGTIRALTLELAGHVDVPRRYRSPEGQLLELAPYSERDLHGPTPAEPIEEEDVAVLVRHGPDLWTRYLYATHPFDVVGWDGWLYPFTFNIADFEPRVGRVHLPPPVHQTFEAPGAVICSFCPRPYDFDRDAIAVPYNHANVDSDEVLFYVAGSFMSRRGSGIGAGSMSLHPAGFVHGPQPGSVEAAFGEPGTEETAVMVDTFARLELGDAARGCEDAGYFRSWAGR